MDLLRQIKEAESRAKAMVEEARGEVDSDKKLALAKFDAEMAEAVSQRKIIIEEAVGAASKQAEGEIVILKSKTAAEIEVILSKAAGAMDGAGAKVIEYIRG